MLNVDETAFSSLRISTSTTNSTGCFQDTPRVKLDGLEEEELAMILQVEIFVAYVRNNFSASITKIAPRDCELYTLD